VVGSESLVASAVDGEHVVGLCSRFGSTGDRDVERWQLSFDARTG
jgi:hypothetical protein